MKGRKEKVHIAFRDAGGKEIFFFPLEGEESKIHCRQETVKCKREGGLVLKGRVTSSSEIRTEVKEERRDDLESEDILAHFLEQEIQALK